VDSTQLRKLSQLNFPWSGTIGSQALTEFDMVTVQGQTGLSPSESETVTSYTVSAAAADLSRKWHMGYQMVT